MSDGISRRRFLRTTGVAAIGGGIAAVTRTTPGHASSAGLRRRLSPAGLQSVILAPLSGTVSGNQTHNDGFEVPAGTTLAFDPNVSTTVTVRANVIVYGTLEMKPAQAAVVHKLVFADVNESIMVGGGLDPLATDVGLWVMGAGKLDLAGAEKQSWNRTGDHETWSNSDELIVGPTAVDDYDFRSFTRGGTVPTIDNPYGREASFLEPSRLTFSDIAGNTHVANIEAIAAAGITQGCTTVLYCPNNNVTRGQMAAFLTRAMSLPAAPSAGFTDTVGHTFEDDINRVAAARITQGRTATTYAPDDPVTRGQMAAFLSRALNLASAPRYGFTDTVGHTFEDDIDRVAAAAITLGKTATTYAPDENVNRGQMASFLARAFELPIPAIDDLTDGTAFRAEVLNLTRNVQIEGTSSGKTHIFIRSSVPQSIRYAAIRYVAPNFDGGNDATGRYGLHFHHCEDGSRGSLVQGCVVRDADGHAFVPHHSNGVAMVNCISYDTLMDAFWWDEGKDHQTDDIVWDKCVAAKVDAASDHNPHRVGGFALQFGERCVVTNCVAVGVMGQTDSAGFKWPEFANNSVWTFASNVSHNNRRSGLFTWQNDTKNHNVGPFTSYHNGNYGINHGAYFNEYFYHDAILYGNGFAGVILKAVNHLGTSAALRFERLTIDGAGISENLVINGDHTTATENVPLPTRFVDCAMLGETGVKILVRNVRQNGAVGGQGFKDRWDFIDCGLQVADVEFTSDADPDSLVRCQNGSSAFEVDTSGSRTISPFA
ncbi:MAG: S-layer homology domain-containing protein [Acidimicrobiia bacterium]|nr:S-layer homology domain-containing protein [Acidimicrobiia bacterium]